MNGLHIATVRRQMTSRPLIVAVAILTLLASAHDAAAQRRNIRRPGEPAYSRREGKAEKAVSEGAAAGNRMRVIVHTRSGVTKAVRTRAGRSGKVGRTHKALDGFATELKSKDVDTLLKDRDVLGVSIDARIQAPKVSAATLAEYPYAGKKNYDAQALRATLGLKATDVGRGTGVAVVDSGIAPLADLWPRISAFYDFTRGGTAVATAPSDKYGHGTHVASLIAGNGANSEGRNVAVAPAAHLIGLKVLDDHGAGYTSDVIAAIEFAITNKRALGIDVLNLSLGHVIYEAAATDPLVQVVERAVRAGIIVVVSAGNFGMNPDTKEVGYAGITSPGNAPSALTVGAMRHRGTATRLDDEIAQFSSRGPTWFDGFIKPDVMAPGQALVAAVGKKSELNKNEALKVATVKGAYAKVSGTSMAAAVTSGVVALMIDANRRDEGASSVLTPNTVKAILQFTAIPLPDDDQATPSVLEQGAGGINGAGALALTRAIDPAVPVGSPWLETGLEQFSTIAGTVLAWSDHIVWGDHVVWGDTALWHLEAFDDHIVWGDSFVHGINEVMQSVTAWGTHIVWGDDDDHVVWGDRYIMALGL